MIAKQFNYIRLLKISCVLIIAGNGTALLTGSSSLGHIFSKTSTIEIVFGWCLILLAIPLVLPKSAFNKWKAHYLLLPATGLLFSTSYASFIDSGYVPEQLIEHAIKLFIPLVLFRQLAFESSQTKETVISLKVLVALTFIGHGIFALGVNYVPSSFVEMTTEILGMSVPNTYLFLKIVGYLDILCAILIFFNSPVKPVYFYLIFWGLITALARLVYGLLINEGSAMDVIHWTSNMAYRLPHGIIPIVLLHFYRPANQLSST